MKMGKDMDALKQRARGVDLGVKKQDFEKDLASGAFAKRIQLTKALNKEEEKLGKRISYAQSVAEIGLFRASLKKAGEEVSDFRKKYENEISAVNKIGKVFFVGAAAITAFTAAASPDLMTTFAASVKWLGAAIGTAFVPYVATATKWVQDLARWIQALDPTTKSVAAGFVIFGVAAAGVIFVVAKTIILVAELRAAWIALGLSQIFTQGVTALWTYIMGAAAASTSAQTIAVNGLTLAYVRMAIAAAAAWAAAHPAAAAAVAVGVGFAAGATAGMINKAMKASGPRSDQEGEGGGKSKGLLLSAQRPAQMMEIADAWKQAQLAGASVTGPEGETIKIQRENRVVLDKIAASTQATADAIMQQRMDQPPYTRQGTPAPGMPGGVAYKVK